MPRLARGHYRRELAAWACLALGAGAVEGGVTGVIAKYVFAETVDPILLNFAVAVLTSAPAFANIASFLWAGLSQGRDKIRFLVGLQVAAMMFVGLIALAPPSAWGLVVLVIGGVGARVVWSGIIILRSTVWRSNYPRHARAMMAGKIATVQTLLMAATALGIGLALKSNADSFRVIYPITAFLGLAGAWIYRGMRMRGHRALLTVEARNSSGVWSAITPVKIFEILRDDPLYRKYMICMFVFGTGNLMINAPLVIILKDQFAFDPFMSVMITSTIPFLVIPLSIPLWSKLLDRVHIIYFRSIHSWSFVASVGTIFLAAMLGWPELLWLGSVLRGIAFGGGILAWNLGHHDFAPVEKASQYMGVHVTLTGLRGLLALFIPVGVYELLESNSPGSGFWVFALCLALSVCGAIGFVFLRRSLRGPGHDSKFIDGPPVQPPATS